jgi:hypothetical protein
LEIKQFIAPGSGEIDKQRIEIFEAKALRGLKRKFLKFYKIKLI